MEMLKKVLGQLGRGAAWLLRGLVARGWYEATLLVIITVILMGVFTQGFAGPRQAAFKLRYGDAIVCLTVLTGEAGEQKIPHRPGESVREVMQRLGGEQRANTILEQLPNRTETCYENWADITEAYTNGEVRLPITATEQDFNSAIMQWVREQQQ